MAAGRLSPPRARAFDLVIFDCDGVLVDSEPIANEVLARHATAIGVPMTREASIATFVGRSMASVMAMLAERRGAPVPDGFLDAVQAETFARFKTDLRPVAGIAEALDAIEAEGHATCVASSGGHDKLAVTLGLTGLAMRFSGRIFSATEVARGKPAPDLFLHAARRMGVEPGRCAVVEDSRPGVEAARAAGMTAFGYAPADDPAGLAKAGARLFHAMAALPALVREG